MKAICPGGSSAAFFQFPKDWEVLKYKILPDIIKQKEVRVWVVPCSTGQWAYSLAIIFKEVIEEMKSSTHLQIIGTDIDKERIEFAKQGIYKKSIADPKMMHLHGVDSTRLNRFFDKTENGYQVKPEIKEMIEFSQHDLCEDIPFTGISLIWNRWLLQWFDLKTQEKLIWLFFDSLIPSGVLFLNSTVYYRRI